LSPSRGTRPRPSRDRDRRGPVLLT
jgi:hypothetical protein